MPKQSDYEKLQQDFDDKVKELQESCNHTKSEWYEKCWAIGHFLGYKVNVCKNCNKELEEKPTKKERDAAMKKRLRKAWDEYPPEMQKMCPRP